MAILSPWTEILSIAKVYIEVGGGGVSREKWECGALRDATGMTCKLMPGADAVLALP